MSSYQKLKKEIDRLNGEIGRLNSELDTVCLAPGTIQATSIVGSRKIRMDLKKAMAFGIGAGTTEGNGILSLIK